MADAPGVIHQIMKLLSVNAVPVVVFDGVHPEAKQEAIEERRRQFISLCSFK